MSEPLLLTSGEVCRALSISIKTLQILRRTRKIAYLKLGHRSIRFQPEAIEAFLRKREKAAKFAEENCY